MNSVIVTSLQVIPYWLAQMLGAFVSAVVLYGVYIGECASPHRTMLDS